LLHDRMVHECVSSMSLSDCLAINKGTAALQHLGDEALILSKCHSHSFWRPTHLFPEGRGCLWHVFVADMNLKGDEVAKHNSPRLCN